MFKNYNSILVKARGSYIDFDENAFIEAFEEHFGVSYEGNVRTVRYASQAIKESVNTENIILFIDSFKDYNREDNWKSAERDRRKDVNPDGKLQYKVAGDDVEKGYFGEDNLLQYIYDNVPEGVKVYMAENHRVSIHCHKHEHLTVNFFEFNVERQHGFSDEVIKYAAYSGLKAPHAKALLEYCKENNVEKNDFVLNGFIPCPHCMAEGKIHWQFFNPDSAYNGVKEYSGAANSVVCSECSHIINRDDVYPNGQTVIDVIHQLESELATKSEFKPNPKTDLEDYRSLKMTDYDEYIEMLMTTPEGTPVRLSDKTKVNVLPTVVLPGKANADTNKGSEWKPMSIPFEDDKNRDPIKESVKRWQNHFRAVTPDGTVWYDKHSYEATIELVTSDNPWSEREKRECMRYLIPHFPASQSNIRF